MRGEHLKIEFDGSWADRIYQLSVEFMAVTSSSELVGMMIRILTNHNVSGKWFAPPPTTGNILVLFNSFTYHFHNMQLKFNLKSVENAIKIRMQILLTIWLFSSCCFLAWQYNPLNHAHFGPRSTPRGLHHSWPIIPPTFPRPRWPNRFLGRSQTFLSWTSGCPLSGSM